MTVALGLVGPPDPEAEGLVEVGGRSAFVRLDKGDESLSPTTPDCSVTVFYQRSQPAQDTVETATVKVQAAVARPESLCAQAKDLATTVIRRLAG